MTILPRELRRYPSLIYHDQHITSSLFNHPITTITEETILLQLSRPSNIEPLSFNHQDNSWNNSTPPSIIKTTFHQIKPLSTNQNYNR